jgi:hypothetical protein
MFLKSQFDKILISALLLFLMFFWQHAIHHNVDPATVQWLEKSIDILTGSLGTLVTGQMFRGSNNPEPKN